MIGSAPGTPIVLVDMDEVLADLIGGLRRAARIPDLPHTAHILADCARSDTEREHVLDVLRQPGFALTLDPLPGAVDAVAQMVEAGLSVFICSSPALDNPTCASDKLEWVDRHLGRDMMMRTILTKDKTTVRGDVLIDDKAVIRGVLTPTWTQVYFTRPYNVGLPGPRIDDWSRWRDVLLPAVAA